MIVGPTKPPIVPIELMNARPPAAARPLRNRGGIVQNSARAALTPLTATVIHSTDIQKEVPANRIDPTKPTAASAHANARLPTLLPRRSTCPAQRIIVTLATA